MKDVPLLLSWQVDEKRLHSKRNTASLVQQMLTRA